ncbi:MAG: FAD-dependent tricarballylate dehydrogenase TcuA [Deltaproteobacteria bacterium]
MDVKKRIAYDVVIIGAGNAGLVAAIEARNHGASVLLLEKGPRERRGGNSRLADGQFRVAFERGLPDFEYLLKDSVLPKGQIEIEPYPKDHYYADLMRVTEGLADQQWAETIVNESMNVVRWIKDQGFAGWSLDPSTQIKKDGDKLFWPSGDVVLSSGSGETLVEGLFRIAESKQTDILYETAAQSFIANSDGEITGLVAKSRDGMIQIDGKAIILACGGFESSPEMRRRYLGEGWDLMKVRGTRNNTGDGFSMALAVGAQTCGHWGCAHASIVSEDSSQVEAVGSNRYSYLFGIMVNTGGRRFVDEGENFIGYTYAKMGKQVIKQPGGVAYQIFDAKVSHLLKPEYDNVLHTQSKTLEALAEEIDIDPDTFVQTVNEYNAAITPGVKFDPSKRDGLRTTGLNPDKTNWAQPIDTPPYKAFAVVCGITFSYGGLKVNKKCQVIDTRDIPIEGLYCIGEMSGGLFYYNCPGGTGLMKGAIGGRIAAVEAVAWSSRKMPPPSL